MQPTSRMSARPGKPATEDKRTAGRAGKRSKTAAYLHETHRPRWDHHIMSAIHKGTQNAESDRKSPIKLRTELRGDTRQKNYRD